MLPSSSRLHRNFLLPNVLAEIAQHAPEPVVEEKKEEPKAVEIAPSLVRRDNESRQAFRARERAFKKQQLKKNKAR